MPTTSCRPRCESIARQPPRDARHGTGAGRRALCGGIAALGVVGACLAAEPLGGLGSAFRPEAGADAPAAASGPDRPAGGPPGLRIVVLGPSRAAATIDGRLVHVGDEVAGMKVKRISRRGVELAGEDGVKQLWVVDPALVRREPAVNAAQPAPGGRP